MVEGTNPAHLVSLLSPHLATGVRGKANVKDQTATDEGKRISVP